MDSITQLFFSQIEWLVYEIPLSRSATAPSINTFRNLSVTIWRGNHPSVTENILNLLAGKFSEDI